MGMSSVALLFMYDPDLAGIKGFAFFGDTAMRAGTLPPAGHKADVIKTTKYSRFRANKKRGAHFEASQLTEGRLPPKAEGWKIEALDSNHRGDTRRAVHSP
jgi:hypothetical protein